MHESRATTPASNMGHVARRGALALAVVVIIYLMIAYVALPAAWIGLAELHPALEKIPNITYTGDDHPGDPINISLIGSDADLKRAMLGAGWHPADPITLESCLEIAVGTVLRRPYLNAPVSALYFDGRKQDLAFEQPVGHDPRRRHHVRFWRSEQLDDRGRPAWSGSATYDDHVGLSHTTGEITHHIAADVDAERDHLAGTLRSADVSGEIRYVAGFHKVRSGHNGGGDPWRTDGRLLVAVLRPH